MCAVLVFMWSGK
uniref:Uncharacterized protein n=1 Tax=Anguilla anguilla TaxID=7936 RepID=A0A0E9THP7_ANGAN